MRREQTEKALSDIIFKKKRLLEVLLDGTIKREEYDLQKSEYELKELELNEKLAKQTSADDKAEIIANHIFDFAANAKELFNSSQQGRKRQILEILVANSRVEGISACFNLKKPFDTFVKGLDFARWRRV